MVIFYQNLKTVLENKVLKEITFTEVDVFIKLQMVYINRY